MGFYKENFTTAMVLLLLNCSSRKMFFGLKVYAVCSASYNCVSTLTHKVLRNEDTATDN